MSWLPGDSYQCVILDQIYFEVQLDRRLRFGLHENTETVLIIDN